ncbi:hypothetical protein HTSR_2029 [Halodesulfurarchaeum formicicum]|uniref:DUF424 domain-containing protein n=1 Tax=Halodesulfurarchaeum formicicum TaxID=1873524 RepID=A0A1D8S754_9EURY|nr:DUF424 domain-containing protein [Halodesulfurarchaeum formicicum]AOW81190.1 hypothetical protein HTSR_2029 [Halodesulfurarchaeum formicicum]
MILSERRTDRGLLVTVCDAEVLGETFEDESISIEVTEDFYGGEPVETETVVDALSRASIANLVGTESVALAIEEGFVDEERVLDVGETRHAQYLRL